MSEQQGLTFEDYELLNLPFASEDIGGKGKNPYIYRSAIMERLKMIDPNYQDYIDPRTEVEGDTVTVWGSLTLNGVTRWNSASVAIQCWRKEQDGSYTRFGEYEYAQALANAKMSAATGLLQRCAAKFGVGIEMKERAAKAAQAARRGQNPPPAGQPPSRQKPPPPPETPKHWALNGDGKKIDQRMKDLGLTWNGIKSHIEAGKTLEKLSDTTLAYDAVYRRLDEISAQKIADELEARRQGQPAAAKGDEPFSVKCTALQKDDQVYGLNGRLGKPSRLLHYLGDTADGVFAEWIVLRHTQYETVVRLPFQKDLTFKILRVETPEPLAAKALEQVEDLKDSYARFSSGAPVDATT